MIIVLSISFLNMTHQPTASTDQATQVNFPVLLRSQQKALKRYATLSDINRPIVPRFNPSTNLWSTVSTISGGGHLARPRSLHVSGNSLELASISSGHHNHRDRDISRHKTVPQPPLELLAPTPTSAGLTAPSSGISGVSGTSGYRSRLGTYTTTAGSYDGSDGSYCDRYSPGFVYSGQYKAVHHSKWKIGVENQPDSISTGKTMCSCHHETPSSARHTNTPEALSWRRLHMSRAKLKATATTSELLSGFAMVAMVELQINEPTTVPEWLFVLFAVCTTILVAVHIFALMISTYILPNIDAISKLDVCELVSESPHERMRGFIELAWAFSTVLGLFLFLVEIAILCWVKFWDYSFTAAIAATVIVIPVLVVFVAFAVHFYHSLVAHKCDASTSDIQQLEDMKRTLDQAVSPV